MPEQGSLNQPTETPPEKDERIAVVRLMVRTTRPLVFMLVGGLFVGLLFVFVLAALLGSERAVSGAVTTIILGLVGIAAGLLIWGTRRAAAQTHQNELMRKGLLEGGEGNHAQLTMRFAQANWYSFDGSLWQRLMSGYRMRAMLASVVRSPRMARPITIIDSKVSKAASLIPLVPMLIEPETIRAQGEIDLETAHGPRDSVTRKQAVRRQARRWGKFAWSWVVIVFAVLIASTALLHRNYCCFALVGLSVLPPLVQSFWLTSISGHPVAGMGVVRDGRDRVWSVEDSVMMVQQWRDRIRIDWYSPANGLLTTYLPSVQDRGFVDLWQRWNHPQPRVELGA